VRTDADGEDKADSADKELMGVEPGRPAQHRNCQL
jgi:hypothetical protein